jgi:hypothetical protein
MGGGRIASRILNLCTRWRWVVSFTPRPLYLQGKGPWCPLDRRLGGPQSRSERGGEEKNSQPLPGLEHFLIQPVAQSCTTELPSYMFICVLRWTNLATIYTQTRAHTHTRRSLQICKMSEMAILWSPLRSSVAILYTGGMHFSLLHNSGLDPEILLITWFLALVVNL